MSEEERVCMKCGRPYERYRMVTIIDPNDGGGGYGGDYVFCEQCSDILGRRLYEEFQRFLNEDLWEAKKKEKLKTKHSTAECKHLEDCYRLLYFGEAKRLCFGGKPYLQELCWNRNSSYAFDLKRFPKEWKNQLRKK